MAERRMFAKTIIDSDAFLDMPLSAQTLHYDRRWEVKPDESDEATMIAYSIILQEYN